MIRLLHLYPRELDINGDVGNVIALERRAVWRGAEVEVVPHHPGLSLPSDIHFVHVGSGPVSSQLAVHEDVIAVAPVLREWANDGVPFLAIAGGWQLLGRSLTLTDGRDLEAAGVFPTRSRLTSERIVGEVFTPSAAGFENHGAVTTLDDAPAPWPVARFGTSIATTLHGPFLPMNPVFADELLEVAAQRAGVPLAEADERTRRADDVAARAREAIRRRL